MNFLTPLYLAAAATVIAPIVLHLIRQRPVADERFSSLMFLTPTPPRLNRRSRISNWWLLLMRCGVVAALAFAFARPYFTANADVLPQSPQRLRMVLVDTSASMRRGDLWTQAVAAAREAADDLSPGDAVWLASFDRDADVLLELSEDPADRLSPEDVQAALEELASREPTWAATDYAAALQAAADRFESWAVANDAAAAISEVVLISDMHSGGAAAADLQQLRWPERLTLTTPPLDLSPAGNATASILGLSVAETAAGGEAGQPTLNMRLRLSADAQVSDSSFELRVAAADGGGEPRSLGTFQTPAGQSRVFNVDAALPTAGELRLAGDATDLDNTWHFAYSPPLPTQWIYVSDRTGPLAAGESGYYLSKIADAASPTLPRLATLTSERFAEAVADPASAVATDPQDALVRPPQEASLIVLDADVRASAAAATSQCLAAGRTVLLTLDRMPQQPAELKAWWSEVVDGSEVSIEEAPVDDFLLWQGIAMDSRLFAPFDTPQASDFTKIRFQKARKVIPGDDERWRTLVEFDSGDPAILQRAVGPGELLVLCGGWQQEQSNLALSTKFVPLLLNMGVHDRGAIEAASWVVGEPVDAAVLGASDAVITPSGEAVPLRGGGFTPTEPGLYRWSDGGGERLAAANLDRRECDLDPLPPNAFESFGVSHGRPTDRETLAAQMRQMKAVELEAAQQPWRWLVVGCLGLVAAETLLSRRRIGNT